VNLTEGVTRILKYIRKNKPKYQYRLYNYILTAVAFVISDREFSVCARFVI